MLIITSDVDVPLDSRLFGAVYMNGNAARVCRHILRTDLEAIRYIILHLPFRIIPPQSNTRFAITSESTSSPVSQREIYNVNHSLRTGTYCQCAFPCPLVATP